MINNLKKTIRQNKALYSFYRKLKFVRGIPLKDFLNFRKIWLVVTVYPFTMTSYKRLSNVYDLSTLVEKNRLEGSFVECGVWRGGCAAAMAFVSKDAKSGRKTWLFDSFEGLPEPTKEDGTTAKMYSDNKSEGNLKTINKCVGPIEDVKKIFFDIITWR